MIKRLTAIAIVTTLFGLLFLGWSLSKDAGVEVDSPQVLVPREEPRWAVVIVASADGAIKIDGVPTDREGVTRHVASTIDDEKTPILIKMSPDADALLLYGLMNAIQDGGGWNLTVMYVDE